MLPPQELAALKTSGGGDAGAAVDKLLVSPIADDGAAGAGSAPEFSAAGRVVQLADLPPGALPTSVRLQENSCTLDLHPSAE